MALAINSVETPCLLLRVPELADAEALMGIFWDPEVVEQTQVTLREPPGGLDLALKNTDGMLRQWALRGYGVFHRSRWGHGFATEAATAALEWVWEHTQIDRIVSLIAPHRRGRSFFAAC